MMPFLGESLEGRNPFRIHILQGEITAGGVEMQGRYTGNLVGFFIIDQILGLGQLVLFQALHEKGLQGLGVFQGETMVSHVLLRKHMKLLNFDRLVELVPRLGFVMVLFLFEHLVHGIESELGLGTGGSGGGGGGGGGGGPVHLGGGPHHHLILVLFFEAGLGFLDGIFHPEDFIGGDGERKHITRWSPLY